MEDLPELRLYVGTIWHYKWYSTSWPMRINISYRESINNSEGYNYYKW